MGTTLPSWGKTKLVDAKIAPVKFKKKKMGDKKTLTIIHSFNPKLMKVIQRQIV